ncbi:MAG: CYTH domain-containing protein [Firmicutes bacterium]|nr:CYTH domain-containing protein [Bacillota bacterium]
MLEKEYKCLLTFDEYDRVKNHFEWDSAKEQTNNYYTDDNGVFSKNRIMFRVREKDNRAVIQVKSRKNSDSALQICEETEFPIDSVPQIIENPEKYTGVKSGAARRIGAAVTLRRSKMWDDNTEICLDMTTYFDKHDYEIEIEYTAEDIPAELKAELNRIGIVFSEPSKGKYSRFLDEYHAK